MSLALVSLNKIQACFSALLTVNSKVDGSSQGSKLFKLLTREVANDKLLRDRTEADETSFAKTT